MEVSELREKKYGLEDAIKDLITEFQNETDAKVESIDHSVGIMMSGGYTHHICVNIKL